MKCKCGEEMTFEFRWDDCQNYCFNVYVCEECGMIVKESVWEEPNEVWIDIHNNLA